MKSEDVPTKRADVIDADQILAEHIRAISDGVKKLIDGPLRPKTIILLVSHASGVGQREAREVLDSMERLKSTYCR